MFAPIPFALVVSLVLALIWWGTRAQRWWVLATVWALYAAYEYLMYARVLCAGECNIRVDLLLIYPVLVISTVWLALAAAYRALKRSRRMQDDR